MKFDLDLIFVRECFTGKDMWSTLASLAVKSEMHVIYMLMECMGQMTRK